MANATDLIETDGGAMRAAHRERLLTHINKAAAWLDALGFSWLTPILKMLAGDSPREQLDELKRVLRRYLAGYIDDAKPPHR